jgi:predicted nuclease of predicted toxin-antitoxin system
MRLLADECFDERLAGRLRLEGHDTVRVPAHSGLDDLAVAALAEREDRVLLTQDNDSGRLPCGTAAPAPASSSCAHRSPISTASRPVSLV